MTHVLSRGHGKTILIFGCGLLSTYLLTEYLMFYIQKGKAEFLNPGGSAKDRIVLEIIEDAEKNGLLFPNSDCCIFEGTSGSTGLSLCMVAHARGYKSYIVMPNDVSEEKKSIIRKMGGTLEIVKPCSIVDPGNYARVAEKRAKEYNLLHYNKIKSNTTSECSSQFLEDKLNLKNIDYSQSIETCHDSNLKDPEMKSLGFFMDQFENINNFKTHYKHTGPEILEQTGGDLDAIVHGSGTGGTIAGLTYYLKPKIPNLKVFLADPPGSGLANKINHNILFSETEKEGTRRRHQTDTIVEGVGLNRLTFNFKLITHTPDIEFIRSLGVEISSEQDLKKLKLDGAYTISDQNSIWMSRWLMKNDGLFIGSTSAMNCVAAVKIAQQLGPGCKILTILCDSGQRHLTKFWNDEHLKQMGFNVDCPHSMDSFLN
ncbi:hypothetical protein BB561_006306 [Smittium simulii]|uniref:Tryptophan synthase beta chain-like PALP domain-containing protein n=1 Tax=Smittium simulii TaxID=133385 RepID=A0A2T9Y587_9FUNG|nr:hypothetical protein BB561_006306 [Smittium simulii]